jgi:hypothetical protein
MRASELSMRLAVRNLKLDWAPSPAAKDLLVFRFISGSTWGLHAVMHQGCALGTLLASRGEAVLKVSLILPQSSPVFCMIFARYSSLMDGLAVVRSVRTSYRLDPEA